MMPEREEADVERLIKALRAASGEEVGVADLWIGEEVKMGALWLHDPSIALTNRATCVRLFYCSSVHPSGDRVREVNRAEMRSELRTVHDPDIRRAVICRYLEWRVDQAQMKNAQSGPASSALDMNWAWGDAKLSDRYRRGTDFYGEGERDH